MILHILCIVLLALNISLALMVKNWHSAWGWGLALVYYALLILSK